MQASLLMDFARKEVIVKMQNRGAKLRFELGFVFLLSVVFVYWLVYFKFFKLKKRYKQQNAVVWDRFS